MSAYISLHHRSQFHKHEIWLISFLFKGHPHPLTFSGHWCVCVGGDKVLEASLLPALREGSAIPARWVDWGKFTVLFAGIEPASS